MAFGMIDRTEEVRSHTIRRLARDAIKCQDGSNIVGLSRSFAEMVTELRPLLHGGTLDIPRHPIVKLWVSKLHNMSDMGMSDPDAFSAAYEECRRMADMC